MADQPPTIDQIYEQLLARGDDLSVSAAAAIDAIIGSLDGAKRILAPMLATSAMSYSAALRALKSGKRVARAGWNGKGMWIVLINNLEWDASSLVASNLARLPWIGMKTADDKFVPWLCSQTDMLAEDWEVVQ